jgi:hypothetical protein
MLDQPLEGRHQPLVLEDAEPSLGHELAELGRDGPETIGGRPWRVAFFDRADHVREVGQDVGVELGREPGTLAFDR